MTAKSNLGSTSDSFDGRPRSLLVLGDSLTFHGPVRKEPLSDQRLWPNVAAHALSLRPEVFARAGWTARDGWWALTRDPRVWSVLPAADALVLALGSMDAMPASIPLWLRESIPYVRPVPLRRTVRGTYRRIHPHAVTLTDGRWRQLPQRLTDTYLTKITTAVRAVRPSLPVVLIGPTPYDAANYPSLRPHLPAVEAGQAWAERSKVPYVDLDPIVGPELTAGRCNPDGLHWSWAVHAAVGEAVAKSLA